MSALPISVPHEEQQEAVAPKWEMKELKPWHKNLASMVAQGIDRQTIAYAMDCTPEYVSMLARQPKMIAYMQELADFANFQLEAQFAKSVAAIGDVLENGGHKEKMQAARLQLEATKRIGSKAGGEVQKEDTVDRLNRLANRLTSLLAKQGVSEEIIDGEVIPHVHAQDETRAEDEGSQGEV